MAETCTKCGICVSFCHKGVYEDGSVVKNLFDCVVGCAMCAGKCPADAVRFPSLVELRDVLVRLRKECGVLSGGLP